MPNVGRRTRVAVLGAVLVAGIGAGEARAAEAVVLPPGPYLLLDRHLIESSDGLTRHVRRPERTLPGPLVTGKEDRNDQPYVTVLRDPTSGRFRMWYDCSGDGRRTGLFTLGYLESADGIHWQRPHRLCDGPPGMRWGAAVIDEGPRFPDAARRYKLGWWRDGGLQVAGSADGLTWTPLAPGVVLRHDHDINTIARDPARGRYVALLSSYRTGKAWKGRRRVSLASTSSDLVHWTTPRQAIAPDAQDPGETQFYCVGGILARGRTLVGMLRVLRDDLPADPGGRRAGIGYTALAWSHDGEHWQRDREPFLDRDPRAGAWDHAMAWADCQLPVGDEVYVYYAGHARGHKIERFTERQLGMVRIPRDRYVAWEAGDAEGTLRTRPVTIRGGRLTVNADAAGGSVRAQVLGGDGKPLAGFAFADGTPVMGDRLEAPLAWKRPLAEIAGQAVRFEFALRRAKVYAFEVRE